MPGVSRRPTAGSAYPHVPTPAATEEDSSSQYSWMKKDLPGGRRLWLQLVVGFFGVALLGAVFVCLGGVFLQKAHHLAMEDSISLPLVWCIIGIVCGALMILGSIVLGKLIISDKWRKNQQPVYSTQQQPSARFRNRGQDGEVQLSLPPPYAENPPVYVVPPPPSESNPPPSYSSIGIGSWTSEQEFPTPITPPQTLSVLLELPPYEELSMDSSDTAEIAVLIFVLCL
ncbi:hypothetical protein CAPTEDRAFT_225635 [Capitella teleta]|uniref:Uncharacterized protein n=1 Tax=Capitella teleta TaxID=283909 RepID=R7VLC2_CAPTE|nr:hypothetical protein CAPTEDRAFT_225635 [Capitella teleta]|eukprot:ELU18126.1 hypothetical protein CAPTEDRAFT_225635 [Capitella teleta]